MDFIKPPGFGCKIKPYPPGYSNPSPLTDHLYQHVVAEREAACYEDIAAIICARFPGINCTAAIVEARMRELLAAEEKLRRMGLDGNPAADNWQGAQDPLTAAYQHGRASYRAEVINILEALAEQTNGISRENFETVLGMVVKKEV